MLLLMLKHFQLPPSVFLSVCPRCLCIYSWLLKSFHWLGMQLRQLWSSPQVLSEHTFTVSIWFKHARRYCMQISDGVVWRMKNEKMRSCLYYLVTSEITKEKFISHPCKNMLGSIVMTFRAGWRATAADGWTSYQLQLTSQLALSLAVS